MSRDAIRTALGWAIPFVLVALGVMAGTFRGVDAALFTAAQELQSPSGDFVASLVGLFGQAEVAALIALVLAVWALRSSRRAALVPLFIALSVAVEALLKVVITHPEPPFSHTIALLPVTHVTFPNAFPSGHVTRTAFLLRVAPRVPGWATAMGIVLMAATRVYLGEHWLSDTIGGALLGLAIADIARVSLTRARRG